jgi:hypothetical protein
MGGRPQRPTVGHREWRTLQAAEKLASDRLCIRARLQSCRKGPEEQWALAPGGPPPSLAKPPPKQGETTTDFTGNGKSRAGVLPRIHPRHNTNQINVRWQGRFEPTHLSPEQQDPFSQPSTACFRNQLRTRHDRVRGPSRSDRVPIKPIE